MRMPSLRSRSYCRPKVTSFSIEYEAPPSPTSALLRKVNSIALRSPAALLCQKVVGRLLKIDYSAAAEVYYMPMGRRAGQQPPVALDGGGLGSAQACLHCFVGHGWGSTI